MIPCVSVVNMRASDAYTIENSTSGLELMNRAAWGIFQAVSWKGRIAIVTGSGNNGGDGFALACILKEHGFACTVFMVGRHLSADCAYYAEKANNAEITINIYETGCLHGFSIIVDCMLGTGFQGSLRGDYRIAVEEINATNAYVVCADINSGMNGDTGVAELAVRSDLTVTIGYVKIGLISENAGKYIKRLVCTDIGIELVKEEFWISEQEESLISGCYPCPQWLDMTIIKAY